MDHQLELGGVPSEHGVDRILVTYVHVHPLEFGIAGQQLVGHGASRSSRTEEGRPHIVLHADHVKARLDEMANGLRADQAA